VGNEPLEKINNFFQKYKRFRYKKHETIIFANDIPPGVFYITSGYVRNFISSKEGKEFTLRIFKAFDFFPTQVILNDRLSSHNFQSLTEAEVIRAPKEDFVSFLKSDNEVLFYITKEYLRINAETLKRLEVTILGNANEKIIMALVFLGETLGMFEGNTVIINEPLTHQEIATMTGLTRETVSIETEKLKKEGLISSSDRLFKILDMDKLRETIRLFE